jgi:hypothetical protein
MPTPCCERCKGEYTQTLLLIAAFPLTYGRNAVGIIDAHSRFSLSERQLEKCPYKPKFKPLGTTFGDRLKYSG